MGSFYQSFLLFTFSKKYVYIVFQNSSINIYIELYHCQILMIKVKLFIMDKICKN